MCRGGLAHSCVTQRTWDIDPYHISWHFLDWQPWTNFWTDDLYPLGVHRCYQVVFYIEYFFLRSLSLRQGHCSLPVCLHLINTSLSLWSAFLLGLQAREWHMSHAVILLPTSHCYSTGSSADKTPVLWSQQSPDILSRLDRNDSFLVLLLGMSCIVNTRNFSNLCSFF